MADGSPLSESLLRKQGYDPEEVSKRHADWWAEHNPHISENGIERREWVLNRLREADGPVYAALVRIARAEFSGSCPDRRCAHIRADSAVRSLLKDGLIIAEDDKSLWLSRKGWKITTPARKPAESIFKGNTPWKNGP
jgi:hypothetical protein